MDAQFKGIYLEKPMGSKEMELLMKTREQLKGVYCKLYEFKIIDGKIV